MSETIKTIKSEHFETTFKLTEEKDEWFSKISNFAGFEQIEFSINLDNYFDEDNWMRLPNLIEYLNENLKKHIENAFEPLTIFSKMTGYFDKNKETKLEFCFGATVIFLDNSFVAANHWQFEIDFHLKNNIDNYGRWFVTFQGNCISGIRRESW